MSFYVLPHNYNMVMPTDILIIYDRKHPPPVISKTLCNYLSIIKKQIDKCIVQWDIYKKYTNPYEYIHSIIPNTKQSISKLKPLSRSYYKMVEISNLLYLLDFGGNKINSFHLAEGPGGFIEAFATLRNNNSDNYHGLTLLSDNNNIPGWKKSKNFLLNNKNVIIEKGVTNDGNILSVKNYIHFANKYKGTMELITGDGGFDFSINFNQQEMLSVKLIIAQILYAISMQKYKGHFILKVFDTFTQISLDYLYLLNLLYENVYIIKPNTSRYANSERYIVAKNFKLRDTTHLIDRFTVIFDNLNTENYIVRLLRIPIPYIFINKIEEYNAILGQQQIENISMTLNLIENARPEKLEILKKQNIQKCIQWCQKYHINHHKSIQYSNIFLASSKG